MAKRRTKPPAPTPQPPAETPRQGLATIYGSALREEGLDILFAVTTKYGDARAFGLCGEIWLHKRQITRYLEMQYGFDRIQIPAAVAIALAKGCQPCE